MWFSAEAGETLRPQTIDYLGDQHFPYHRHPALGQGFPEELKQQCATRSTRL